ASFGACQRPINVLHLFSALARGAIRPLGCFSECWRSAMALRDVLLPDWTDMSDWTAQRECEQLARELAHGFTLTGLDTRAYCGRTHRVARFSRREAGELVHFAFVPGGRVRLGYDGRKFKAQQWQIESFADSEDAPELHQPIGKLFDALHVPERV